MAGTTSRTGSFWPSERQELLLRTVVLPDERGAEAWRALRQGLDVERLERGSVALLPLLRERLAERGVSEPFLARLAGVQRHVWYRNHVGLELLGAMLGALRDEGVETTVLGDAALILRYYGRLGVRPLDEVAVLVDASRRETALATLAAAGWTAALGGSGGHRSLVAPRSEPGPSAALFWRAFVELESSAETRAELWSAREPFEHGGVPTAVLSPTHELLRTCLRAARSRGGVLWAVDATTILAAAGSRVDWELLVADAERLGCAWRLRDALEYLAEVLDAPVPAAVRPLLEATPATGRERLAHRVGGSGSRVLGNLPTTVAAHLVARRDDGALRTALTLPTFIRAEWGLDHAGQLPAAALRRVTAAARRDRAPRRESRREPGPEPPS